jgi:hypothetical protein
LNYGSFKSRRLGFLWLRSLAASRAGSKDKWWAGRLRLAGGGSPRIVAGVFGSFEHFDCWSFIVDCHKLSADKIVPASADCSVSAPECKTKRRGTFGSTPLWKISG